MSFKEIIFDSLHGFDVCLITLEMSLENIERHLSTKLEQVPYDRAGPTLGRAFENERGLQFIAEYLVDYPDIHGTTCQIVMIVEDKIVIDAGTFNMPPSEVTSNLEEFLVFAQIETDYITWKHKSVQFKEYDLWRQDDNGNEAIVKRCRNKSDATLLQRKYENRGHKQIYWIKLAV